MSVSNTGWAVVSARQTVAGSNRGGRAVRWGSGTVTMELANLGTDGSGYTHVWASSRRSANTIVGCANEYVAGDCIGTWAVLWHDDGTAVMKLPGHLGTSSWGSFYAVASAVNDNNTVVGYSDKYVNGRGVGVRAVRWDAGGTTATELGHPGTDARGDVYAACPNAVSDTNTAVGNVTRYVDGVRMGEVAVRWDAGSTTATALGHLGMDSLGRWETNVVDINNADTAVGTSYKFVDGGGWALVRYAGMVIPPPRQSWGI